MQLGESFAIAQDSRREGEIAERDKIAIAPSTEEVKAVWEGKPYHRTIPLSLSP
ncbi:hypothetical protein [Phormidium sp. CCY1219]|uniref:hypothetical protein n=1 Tax=Phormidium sp. CCY1219 TaxID=2886104 RepID=UPI002D1E5FC9|nr:hypothetical protein [Phormidium sp. CCY1219]MEB3826976.1 hypothetical protein [Phormidium sp. CCY1219]